MTHISFQVPTPAELAAVGWGPPPMLPCLNCDCSEACKQTAHLVRWTRRKIAEDTFGRPDIVEAYQLKLAHILNGGYPSSSRKSRVSS